MQVRVDILPPEYCRKNSVLGLLNRTHQIEKTRDIFFLQVLPLELYQHPQAVKNLTEGAAWLFYLRL